MSESTHPDAGTSTADQAREEDVLENQVELIQVIGLKLAAESFIVDILNVSEIVRFNELEITRVPHAHDYVLGVVNLRGKVVPVVDLCQRLQLSSAERDHRARLIVVEIADHIVGFTVDAVSEVLSLPKNQIEPGAAGEDHVIGLATVNDQIMTMLDLEKILMPPVQL